MKPLLSIIVVSFNTAELTIAALTSALVDSKASNLLHGRTEIIVIDNNSTDDSVSKLKEFAKTTPVAVTIITNKKNVGFSTANNQGISASTAPYILLLNSDTIVQKGALEKLVTALEEHQQLGVVAATLLNSDGSLQPQGGHTPTLFTLTNHMFFLDDIPLVGKLLPSTQHTGLRTAQKPHETTLHYQDWVGGTALCTRRSVVEEIGMLDEAIFMYGEDIEFCMRAKKHHWEVAVQPQSRVVHLQSQSSSSDSAIIGELRGYHFIWVKHKPLWQLPLAKLSMELGCFARMLLYSTLLNNKKKASAYLRGIYTLLKL